MDPVQTTQMLNYLSTKLPGYPKCPPAPYIGNQSLTLKL